MANPTSKHSHSRRNKRRANWKGKFPNMIQCPSCNEPKMSHRACPSCGTYNGKKILEIVEKEG